MIRVNTLKFKAVEKIEDISAALEHGECFYDDEAMEEVEDQISDLLKLMKKVREDNRLMYEEEE